MKTRRPKIMTLDKWPKKWLASLRGYVVVTPHVSIFQLGTMRGRKILTSSVSRRGAIPDQDYPKGDPKRGFPSAFEIASNPRSRKDVRKAILSVIKEKIINDITAANGLLEQLGQNQVSIWDVASKLEEQSGYCKLCPKPSRKRSGLPRNRA